MTMPKHDIAERGPVLHELGGVPVAELARRYQTPCYVYDTARIERQIDALRAFDVIRYAQKACSNVAILSLVRSHGVLVDAVSAGELVRARAAGYSLAAESEPYPVVYTADIFDREALDFVAREGVHCNVGSPDMIDQIGHVAPGTSITLRINPGFGHGHSQKTNTGGPQSKHGIWHDQVDLCLAQAARHDLSVTGLHMHIGSGSDLQHLSQVCGAMKQTALRVGRSLSTVSAGGGLPIQYRADDMPIDLSQYYSLWDTTRRELEEAVGHAVRLEVEPGRFLVAEAGYLVTEIRAIKKMGENLFYLVDAGFNNLARPVMYGAYHPIAIAPADRRDLGNDSHRVVVGGPLCESGDIFTQAEGGYVEQRLLPQARVGDYVVIESAGAYGYTMASNYNSKPLAAEVVVHEGDHHVIRRRQSLDDLIAHETIPPPLRLPVVSENS